MPAPLQVGCQVKAKVGPLVDHTKPDGTKSQRRQKAFMPGRIVGAKGPNMFSVLFENGRTKDMRSNTLVFVGDPQFAPPPASAPLQQHQVPVVLPPRSIPATIAAPPPQATTAPAPTEPPLEETVPTIFDFVEDNRAANPLFF
jgi:hypothetical protein